MRIAISGTHFSGKSSLVEALSESLPQYTTVEEPYNQLLDEGYEFAELPSVEDFELQLERSIDNLNESPPNVIFDRCPIDILSYLLSHADVDAFDLNAWLPRVQTALSKLDLVVLLSIEESDRIVLPVAQDAVYRQRVDEILKEIILENSYSLDVDVLEVSGSVQMRAKQVMTYIRSKNL
jgi:predicted ATPase